MRQGGAFRDVPGRAIGLRVVHLAVGDAAPGDSAEVDGVGALLLHLHGDVRTDHPVPPQVVHPRIRVRLDQGDPRQRHRYLERVVQLPLPGAGRALLVEWQQRIHLVIEPATVEEHIGRGAETIDVEQERPRLAKVLWIRV